MKKLIFCFAILSVLCSPLVWARSDNLYDFVSSKNKVNVKVDRFSVSDDCGEIKGEELTNIFKEALRNRRSVNFNIVEKAEDADLVISGEVKDFVYSEKDPIDILIPIGLVVDLIVTQSYARLKFDIQVYSPKKNKIVWEKHLKATLSKSNMPYEESIPRIMEKAAKVFIRKCFNKPKN